MLLFYKLGLQLLQTILIVTPACIPNLLTLELGAISDMLLSYHLIFNFQKLKSWSLFSSIIKY